jgi:hypothetical protein
VSEKQKINVVRLNEEWEIKDDKIVRYTPMKHIKEILALEREPKNLLNIRRLSNDEYVDLQDGEIHSYQHTENRAQNIKGVKRTIKQLRNLINNNFDGKPNELWVTLTYAENMTDTKRLYEDGKKYMMRLKYRYGNIDYITIAEPQGRGAWHTHSLMRFNDHEKIRIENDTEMQPLWEHGFTKTQRLKNVDNIGAYLSAYLADMEICDENAEILFQNIGIGQAVEVKEVDIVNERGVKETKKFIKGARLPLYPPKFNMYRPSRGIIKTETELITYREAKKKIGSSPKAAYRRAIGISSEEKSLNKIYYEQYNTKRGAGQDTEGEIK